MNPQPLDIERIVQEVLRRLQRHAFEAAGIAHPNEPNASNELVISDRVITLRHVEGRLDGVAQVVAPTGAVVTPSVRDELRRARVALKYCSQLQASPQRTAAKNGPGPWLLVDGELATGLISATSIVPAERRRTTRDLATALRESAADLGAGRVVIVTSRAMVATALANRIASLRAAHIREAEDLAAADEQLGANVLVVDTMLAPLLRRTLEFARQSPQPAPRLLKQEGQA